MHPLLHFVSLCLTTTAALASAANTVGTCGGLKDTYGAESCCTSDSAKPLEAPLAPTKRAYVPQTDYTARAEGDYDFVVAGGGTGGIALATRLAQLNLVDGQDVTVGLFEAGRWLEPATEKVPYTLTCLKEGAVVTHTMDAWVPQNWLAAVDAYLKAYVRWMADAKGDPFLLIPAAFGTYGFLPPNELQTQITNLTDLYKTNKSHYGLVENHPEITFEMQGSAIWDEKGNCTYQGRLMGLLPSPWTDVNHNALFAYTGSEDLFFHEAKYQSDHDRNNAQNYPRGKTLGGSGVVNAAVHYGLTRDYLAEIAEDLDDAWWASAEVEAVVNASVARCDCQGAACNAPAASSPMVGASLAEKIRDAMHSDGSNVYEDKDTASYVMNGALSQNYTVAMYPLPADMSERRCMDSFSRAERFNMNVRTRSWNRWRNHRTTPSDALINLINSGVHVCFHPHPSNELILSEHVLRPEQNCARPEGQGAKLHIYTGTYVTKFVVDDDGDDVPRVKGIEYVYEEEQERPDQNRMEPQGPCSPRPLAGGLVSGSLYGNGNDNTADCVNRDLSGVLSVRVDFTTGAQDVMDMDAIRAMYAATTAANGPITATGVLGQKSTVFGQPVQYGASRKSRELSDTSGGLNFALTNIKRATAKRTVISGLGSPQTTKTLLKSGFGPTTLSKRIGVTPRADLPVGDTLTDNSENFIMLETSVAVAFDELPHLRATATESYMRGNMGDNEGDPLSSYLVNLTDDTGMIQYPNGFGDLLMTYFDEFNDTQHYHSNLHIGAGSITAVLGSRLYTNRHKETNAFFPAIVPDWYAAHSTYGSFHPYVLFVDPGQRAGLMTVIADIMHETGDEQGAARVRDYVQRDQVDFLAAEFAKHFRFLGFFLSVAEVSGGTDARHGNMRLTVQNAHPFEKVVWSADRGWLTIERCREMRAQVDLVQGEFEAIIGVPGESSVHSYTRRERPMDQYSQSTTATNMPIISRTNYRLYRNRTLNPVTQEYKRDMSDEDFCDLYAHHVSGHHIQGGVLGGKPTDKWAASDSRGRLYDTKGLVLSDLSWVPRSPDGNPWVSIFSLGNVFAYNLAKDWGYDVSRLNENFMNNV